MKHRSAEIHAWLLLLPALVLLALFTHWPALETLVDSLHSTPRGRRAEAFVGLDNYRQMFEDPVFRQAIVNNFWYALGTIPTSIGLASYKSLKHHHNSHTMIHSRSFMDHTRSKMHESAWRMGEILTQPRREYPHFAAGLMFMHHLDSKVAVESLEKRSQALHATITKLSFILDELHASGHTRLTVIELEHKIAVLQAERAWVNKVAREITEGKLEWKAGIGSGEAKLRRKHGASTH